MPPLLLRRSFLFGRCSNIFEDKLYCRQPNGNVALKRRRCIAPSWDYQTNGNTPLVMTVIGVVDGMLECSCALRLQHVEA